MLPSTSLCSNDFVGNTLKWINLILVHACNAMREMKKSRFLRFYVLFICVFFLVLVWFFKWQNWHTRAIVRLQQSDWLDEEIWGWAWPIRKWAGRGGKGAFLTKCLSSFNNSRWLQKIWLNLSRFWTKYDTNIPGEEKQKGKKKSFFLN